MFCESKLLISTLHSRLMITFLKKTLSLEQQGRINENREGPYNRYIFQWLLVQKFSTDLELIEFDGVTNVYSHTVKNLI